MQVITFFKVTYPSVPDTGSVHFTALTLCLVWGLVYNMLDGSVLIIRRMLGLV